MSKPNSTAGAPRRAGQLRIIAGEWRSRRLPVPDAPGLRPTPDRVRETLFNWLAPVLSGVRCLDLFAGSGALGLEALSRGAGHCLFVESSRPVAAQLSRNVDVLGATARARVHCGDALALLVSPPEQPFDLVFLDPPFSQQWLERCLPALVGQGWLSERAWVYLETSVNEPPVSLPAGWQLHREKIAGQVSYRLFRLVAVAAA